MEYPSFDQISPVNMWLYSLLDTMEVWMNNKLVSVKTNQQYITYFKLLLCCSTEIAAAKSMQSSSTYVDSSPATIISKSALHNVLMYKIEGEKSVSMTGRIFHDLFEVEKYLLPNVDLKI